MRERINDKRKLLNKKKLLLMYISSTLLLTGSSYVDAKEYKSPSAGIIKEISGNLSTAKTKDNKLSSGIIEEIYGNISQNSLKVEENTRLKATISSNRLVDVTSSVYYDFPCSYEFQDYIGLISKEYNVPKDIMMTIIHQETGGLWNANGVISPTNDYGLTQINKCNEEFIKENLGYTMEDILNDPYIAVEAQAFLLSNIMNEYGYDINNVDYENVFGTYNGWVLWRQKEISIEYANSCMQIYEEKFGAKSKKLN